MANIPLLVATNLITELLAAAGLKEIARGKVGHTYELPGHPELLLQYRSNRISIFDFVLNALVPLKGEVLTAMTVFWLTGPLKHFNHHLVACGSGIDTYLPAGLRGNRELQKAAIVIKRRQILPIEFIVRGYLTGSGFEAYNTVQIVCGHLLPPGLNDGSRLEKPLFTPTTKAKEGHDEHIDFKTVNKRYGPELGRLAIALYEAASKYALSRRVIIADTKFELSEGQVLVDEVVTPDSSRFWDEREWEAATVEGKSPNPFDKQSIRNWGKQIVTPWGRGTGIHRLEPTNEEDLDFIATLPVPTEVLQTASDRYLEILQRLTGYDLVSFQNSGMMIN